MTYPFGVCNLQPPLPHNSHLQLAYAAFSIQRLLGLPGIRQSKGKATCGAWTKARETENYYMESLGKNKYMGIVYGIYQKHMMGNLL